jgi:hypothetical protein
VTPLDVRERETHVRRHAPAGIDRSTLFQRTGNGEDVAVTHSWALRAALEEVGQLRERLEQENAYLRQEVRHAGGSRRIVGMSTTPGRG